MPQVAALCSSYAGNFLTAVCKWLMHQHQKRDRDEDRKPGGKIHACGSCVKVDVGYIMDRKQ